MLRILFIIFLALYFLGMLISAYFKIGEWQMPYLFGVRHFIGFIILFTAISIPSYFIGKSSRKK